MNLYEITQASAFTVNLPGTTREEILNEIAQIAACLPAMQAVPATEIAAQLLERERQGSTGFGGGIAIPHARFQQASDFVLFVVTSAKDVAYQALDNRKVRVFFVLLGPLERVRDHLKILATISNLVSRTNLTRELLTASTPTALYENFMRKCRDEDQPPPRAKSKLLMIILYEQDFFHDLLDFFLETGLDGATIIDSLGMGQFISKMPLFAGYIGFMNEQKNHSRTLLVMVPEDLLDGVIKGIEAIVGDLDQKQGAMLIALDVALSKGSMQML